MDYEKAYKTALEKAKIELNADTTQGTKNVLMTVFPELKESENERIRKELIFYLGDMPEDTELRNGVTNRDVLAWLEKQGEQKVPINDFKAKNWYVSEVDGKIHDMTYNPADGFFGKYGAVEYVYILDYSTGRIIVAKHNIDESISDLFERLGLKESQCQYMVSTDILSIEYINF